MVVWNSHVAANYYHQLGRWWRNMLVSYVYRFNLTVHNLRTKLHHFSKEPTYGIRFADLASSIPFGDFVSRISAALQFANKHHLGHKLRRNHGSFHG